MHSHSALGLFLPARAKRGSAETAACAVRATRTSSRMLKSISSAVSAHPLHKTTATCHKTCVRHAKACSSYQKKHVKYSRANLKGANFSHSGRTCRCLRLGVKLSLGPAVLAGSAGALAPFSPAALARWWLVEPLPVAPAPRDSYSPAGLVTTGAPVSWSHTSILVAWLLESPG